ncbi:MAG: hypothetical protein K2X27_07380 [Candidatus Obscuribacterales bacterium]|nr:hypothetical protein [Candidatus Obscuribacterales bacterium]
MAKYLITLLLLAVLCAGGFFFWTTTPQYSLMKLAESVRNHDISTFRNYFDLDGVSNHVIEDLSNEQIRSLGGDNLLQKLLGLAVTRLFKPELAQVLAKNISDYVEKTAQPENKSPLPADQSPVDDNRSASNENGTESNNSGSSRIRLGRAVRGFFKEVVDAIRPPSFREVLSQLGLRKENFRGLTPFQIDGKLCHVAMKFQEEGKKELLVEMEMENVDNHWRVIRFSNLDALAKAVADI